ncbi:hypothetical protein [Pelobacter propionicus]|uniref:Uncharacterized protein n=1 Tax=Pelobacter propionicus (strain DSM 2379 / NBRC 103807 / OttBd1) TaxID=338966 RepID=A1AQ78_PELPD|nr:hypothetical protein [Pelobacter propionicus]ABK99498.1 hypothetical protein Ppro_1888 [Pelobacter propionicus DSM 2379]
MIPNLQPQTIYAVHLRAPSSTGGKDWVGSVTSYGEIHTYWGRTNQINQHAAKLGNITALHKIISQKKNGKDRYQQVDEYHPQQGWQSQRDQTPSPSQAKAPPPVPAPVVDWVEAPPASIQWDF